MSEDAKYHSQNYNTNGGVSRCQGVTARKERCKRDVTHQLGGVGYCEKHFFKRVEVKRK